MLYVEQCAALNAGITFWVPLGETTKSNELENAGGKDQSGLEVY